MGEDPHPLDVVVELLAGKGAHDRGDLAQRSVAILFGLVRVWDANFRYTQYVNRLRGRSGDLWQNHLYSCALDEDHYWTAMAYVEQNRVRARLARRAWAYRRSSAAAHSGRGRDRSGMLEVDSATSRWQGAIGKKHWQGCWVTRRCQPFD